MRAEDIGFYPNGAPEAGEAPPPRRRRPAGLADSVWQQRAYRWDATERDRRRAAILAALRAAFAGGERALVGWPAILQWLHDHSFRNREGRPLTARTVHDWHRRLNFPLLRGHRAFVGRSGSSPPWTSTYLVLAWAVTL